jgi:hypothetical protein
MADSRLLELTVQSDLSNAEALVQVSPLSSNWRDGYGNTALHWAAQGMKSQDVRD